MKKSILLLAIGMLALTSCKKETLEPVAPEPTATTPIGSDYSIEFLAGDYTSSHYTDITIKVNGDDIGTLSSSTTTMTAEDVSNYYNANGQFPNSGALTFSADLNSYYNIEAFTSSGDLIGSTGSKELILVPDNDFGGDKPWLTDDVYTGSGSSPVGVNGNDCSFVGINNTLLLIFEIDG